MPYPRNIINYFFAYLLLNKHSGPAVLRQSYKFSLSPHKLKKTHVLCKTNPVKKIFGYLLPKEKTDGNIITFLYNLPKSNILNGRFSTHNPSRFFSVILMIAVLLVQVMKMKACSSVAKTVNT
jgi:hypothetical protein